MTCKNCCWYRCTDREKCPEKDKECNSCGAKGHFARSKRCKRKEGKLEKVSKVDEAEDETEDSEEAEVMTGRIREFTVGGMVSEDRTEVTVGLTSPTGEGGDSIRFLTDTGVRKTILNEKDWRCLKKVCELRETRLRFRPYGTKKWLLTLGKARVTMTARAGATIQTEVYVNKGEEESLLGREDAEALGIVEIRVEGATNAVTGDGVLQNEQADPDQTAERDREMEAEVAEETERIGDG